MIASAEYEQIARITANKIVGLIREGWRAPFAIHVTGADDEFIFDEICNEDGKFPSHNSAELLNPKAMFPVTVSISDQNGQTLHLEISENFTVH
jgi:hypothetical protein